MFLWKFPIGYAKIEVVCKRPERFVNEALKTGLSLHNIERISSDTVTAVARFFEYGELCTLAAELDVQLTMLKSGGFSVLLASLFKRKALLLSLTVSIALSILLSKRILFFEVNGTDAELNSRVLALLEENGVSRGTLASSVDTEELALSIASLDAGIALARVEIDGVLLRATLFDKLPPLGGADTRPASIYASKDCIIFSISSLDGREQVRAGQAVKKDQLLISGDVTPEQTEGEERVKLVHARGDVIGEVAYRFDIRVERQALRPKRTGRSEKAAAIELFGMSFFSSPLFSDSETILTRSAPLDACFLPVFACGGSEFELKLTQASAEQGEMLTEALERADASILAGVPKDALVISKSTELIWEEDGALTLTVTVHTYEKIGYMRYI